MSGNPKWKRGDWEIEAASEIDDMLGRAVRRNAGVEYGFFVGVSLADMADVIEKWRTGKNEEKYYIFKEVTEK